MPYRAARDDEIEAAFEGNRRRTLWYELGRFARRVYGRHAVYVCVTRSDIPDEQCNDWADMWDIRVYNRRGQRLMPYLQTRWWKRQLDMAQTPSMIANEHPAFVAQALRVYYNSLPFPEAPMPPILVDRLPIPNGPTLYVYAPGCRRRVGSGRRLLGDGRAQWSLQLRVGKRVKALVGVQHGDRAMLQHEQTNDSGYRPILRQDAGRLNEYRGARFYWLSCVRFAQDIYGASAHRLEITGEWRLEQADGEEPLYTSVITHVVVYDQAGRLLQPDLSTV